MNTRILLFITVCSLTVVFHGWIFLKHQDKPILPSDSETVKMHLAPECDEKTAFILVDVQRDFCKGGSLEVPNSGSEYIQDVIAATTYFKKKGAFIIATQDYHPRGHMSFASSHPGKKPFEKIDITLLADGTKKNIHQTVWPDHCVQGTPGADILVPAHLIDSIVKKGTNKNIDSYSGFQDDGGQETGLSHLLQKKGINCVVIVGIATDYCVRATVLHACQQPGLLVYVIPSLCRGVAETTSLQALQDMKRAGARLLIDF